VTSPAILPMSFKPVAFLALGAAWMAILLVATGCATGTAGSRGVDSLHVFTVPVALDLDGTPGPDAFGLTLYASAGDAARGIPVTTGVIEIQMYDGALATDGSLGATPLRVWTFTTADLKKLAVKTSLGSGYRFTMRWNDTPPRQGRLTVVVRHVPARGKTIQSVPTVIAVPAVGSGKTGGKAPASSQQE
jgi:hypothetical protein